MSHSHHSQTHFTTSLTLPNGATHIHTCFSLPCIPLLTTPFRPSHQAQDTHTHQPSHLHTPRTVSETSTHTSTCPTYTPFSLTPRFPRHRTTLLPQRHPRSATPSLPNAPTEAPRRRLPSRPTAHRRRGDLFCGQNERRTWVANCDCDCCFGPDLV